MKIKNLHKFCTKCNKVISNKEATCGGSAQYARNCPNKGKHRFQSRVYNPQTKKTLTKCWDVKDKKELLQLHLDFEQAAKRTKPVKVFKKPFPTILKDCISLYLDWMQDIDLPEHEHKNLSKDYILSVKKKLLKFMEAAGKTIHIRSINNSHVGVCLCS